jgi:hypothetical protein
VHGTTLRVYRFIYRQGHPVGIHDIQRGLDMASPSTAHYHVEKLLSSGLIREEEGGYTVDRVFLDNFIRIHGTVLPLQFGLAAFFAASLAILFTLARPAELTSSYVIGIAVCVVALGASVFQALRGYHDSF